MSKSLKGVIFSISDVLAPERNWALSSDDPLLNQLVRLFKFLQSKDLQPVIFANHEKMLSDGTNLEKFFVQKVGQIPWLIAERDKSLVWKPNGQALPYVLERMGWDQTEAVYVGNRKDDMLTAVNPKVLFLNAIWYSENTPYGIKFQSPFEIARFVSIFCLRESLWHYSIQDEGFEYYSLAPFSTRKPEFAFYSEDARETAKFGAGHPDFWTQYLWSTIYFSELYKKIDFIVPYPGHRAANTSHASNIMEEPLLAFTKCFKIEYLRDFIIRHTTATKSQTARIEKKTIDHTNQLNTIHLNKTPLKGSGKTSYSKNPIKGKNVLVVDDFCTEGYSLEAARIYLKNAGAAQVFCLSWLKTINTNYTRIRSLNPQKFDSFIPNKFTEIGESKIYLYRDHIVDSYAPEEIYSRLAAYDSWSYPPGI